MTISHNLFDSFDPYLFFSDKLVEGPDSFCHHCICIIFIDMIYVTANSILPLSCMFLPH